MKFNPLNERIASLRLKLMKHPQMCMCEKNWHWKKTKEKFRMCYGKECDNIPEQNE